MGFVAGYPGQRAERVDLDGAAARIAPIAYLLLRAIEFNSVWIVAASSCEAKMSLGRRVGRYAELLKRFVGRLSELGGRESISGLSSDEAFLATFLSSLSDNEIRQASDGIDRRLAGRISAACANLETKHNKVIDEPTLLLLRSSQLSFEPGRLVEGEPDGRGVIAYSSESPLPALPAVPGREERLTLEIGPFRSFFERVGTEPGRKTVAHDIFINIEVSATEVCALAIVRERTMPLAFKLDMARQVWDESRHAELAFDRYREMGGEIDAVMPYRMDVWNRWQSGASLAEKLAIQQVVQEGNALDVAPLLCKALREAGDEATAAMFEFFIADEELHVMFGNRWVRWLNDGDEDLWLDCVHRAAQSIPVTIPAGPFDINEPARGRAGFSDGFMRGLRSS